MAVNWSGDETLKGEDWIGYLGALVGVEPVYVYDDDKARRAYPPRSTPRPLSL